MGTTTWDFNSLQKVKISDPKQRVHGNTRESIRCVYTTRVPQTPGIFKSKVNTRPQECLQSGAP